MTTGEVSPGKVLRSYRRCLEELRAKTDAVQGLVDQQVARRGSSLASAQLILVRMREVIDRAIRFNLDLDFEEKTTDNKEERASDGKKEEEVTDSEKAGSPVVTTLPAIAMIPCEACEEIASYQIKNDAELKYYCLAHLGEAMRGRETTATDMVKRGLKESDLVGAGLM